MQKKPKFGLACKRNPMSLRRTSVSDEKDYLLEFCISTWDKLINEPQYRMYYEEEKKLISAIYVDNFDHVRIMQIITERVRALFAVHNLGEWFVCGGHSGKNLFIEKSHIIEKREEKDKQWLILLTYNSHDPKKDISTEIKSILEKIRKGWKKSNIKDYPNVLTKENPEEFCFYVKEKIIKEEDVLIRFICSSLNLNEKIVSCYDYWTPYGASSSVNWIYLWAKKDKLEEIKDALMFDI